MWRLENRARYDRTSLRHPSDLTDEEWALVAPLIPPAKRGGGKRSVDMRRVVDGLLYVLSTGGQWRAVPKELASRSTVHGYFDLWVHDGTLERIYRALIVPNHESAGPPGDSAASEGRTIKGAETPARRTSRSVPIPARRAKSKHRSVATHAHRLGALVVAFVLSALAALQDDRLPLDMFGL